jgi:hypothetical protein
VFAARLGGIALVVTPRWTQQRAATRQRPVVGRWATGIFRAGCLPGTAEEHRLKEDYSHPTEPQIPDAMFARRSARGGCGDRDIVAGAQPADIARSALLAIGCRRLPLYMTIVAVVAVDDDRDCLAGADAAAECRPRRRKVHVSDGNEQQDALAAVYIDVERVSERGRHSKNEQ